MCTSVDLLFTHVELLYLFGRSFDVYTVLIVCISVSFHHFGLCFFVVLDLLWKDGSLYCGFLHVRRTLTVTLFSFTSDFYDHLTQLLGLPIFPLTPSHCFALS